MENRDNYQKKSTSNKSEEINDLKEFLEIKKLSRLLNQFYSVTGLSNFIVDIKGNILHGAGLQSECIKSHRRNEKSLEKYTIYVCQNGMVDVTIPIIINRICVANLFLGQFFFEKPDKEFFIKQTKELGFDQKKYMKVFEGCPVHNKETILRYLDFLSGLISTICELTLKINKLNKQNEESEKRAAELIIADKELAFQSSEKADRAAELIIADKELAFQSSEKADRAAELVIAGKELVFQSSEKADRAAELIVANKELVFQNREKEKRAAELIVANKELIFQNKEKEKRAAELVIANKELYFQNKEKEKRAAELIIANKELAFQNEEKEKRAAELAIANKELAFQNEEKEKRAAELAIANKELAFQNTEKEKRAAELLIANEDLVLQNEEISYIGFHDFLTGLYNRIYFEEEKKRLDVKEQLPISIIMGDINGLKLVNDGFGHFKGDELLVEIGKILKNCCRKNDTVSRIGGDEFGILLPKTDNQTAQRICNDIYNTCREYESTGSLIYPSISLGHATKNVETETIDGVFMVAEESMFKQKLLESKSAHSSMIASIRAIMFEKSQETEEHAERMVQLSKSIGMAMSLSDDQLNELELLATLHDIGKMGINVNILAKPGKLTDEEWIEMRKHPEIGFRIAQATPEFMPIAQYILCHHERWDGNGYPQGLSGERIPLLSRIVSIADSFDAMTNDRVYRTALTKEDALEEIRRNSGTQFDPDILQMFFKIVS